MHETRLASLGDMTQYFGLDTASQAVDSGVNASADLAKRASEAQALAITTAAQNSAQGFKTTAAQIENDLSKKLFAFAIVGGGLYALAKHKGWI